MTGSEILFVASANATLSNADTVCPREIVSLPPVLFEPVSWVYFVTSAGKFDPFGVSWLRTVSARTLVFTRMWRTSRLASCLYWASFDS